MLGMNSNLFNPTHFSSSQVVGLIGFGALLWGIGVIKIQYAGHILYVSSWGRIGTFITTIPLGYALIVLTERIFRVPSSQRLPMVAIVGSTTLIMDGLAYSFFPMLYENKSIKRTNPRSAVALSRIGAGWLLYGTGLCFALAIWTTRSF